MPRGIYDRSKMKARRSVQKSATSAAEPKTKTAVQSAEAPRQKRKYTRRNFGATTSPAATQSHVPMHHSVNELYDHINVLTNARSGLNSVPGGQPSLDLIGKIDTELVDSVAAARLWREERFPSTKPEVTKEVISKAQPAQYAQPAGGATFSPPGIVPPNGPSANAGNPPVPFTPASVQEAMNGRS